MHGKPTLAVLHLLVSASRGLSKGSFAFVISARALQNRKDTKAQMVS